MSLRLLSRQRRVYPQVPQKQAVHGRETAPGGGVPKTSRAEEEQNCGGASSTKSRAHVDLDQAEVCSLPGDRAYQGRSSIYLAGVHGENERNFIATQQPL
jgi:hypothetical protein